MNQSALPSFAVDLNRRILVIDDDPCLQRDYARVLAPEPENTELNDLAAELFGRGPARAEQIAFELDSATQGEEGISRVIASLSGERRYAMAFVDVRMPPGIDGIETIRRIWAIDPDIQIVICSAYSDVPWEQITATLGQTDRLLILKKPFDTFEVRQLALALTYKWSAAKSTRRLLRQLQDTCDALTRQLQKNGDRCVPNLAMIPA